MKITSGSVVLIPVDPAISDFQPIPALDLTQQVEATKVEGGPTYYSLHGAEQGAISPQELKIIQATDALAQEMYDKIAALVADDAAQPVSVQWGAAPGGRYDGLWKLVHISTPELSQEFRGEIDFEMQMIRLTLPVALAGSLGAVTVGHQHNDLVVGAGTWNDFVDSPKLRWSVTDDPGNNRTIISAAVSGAMTGTLAARPAANAVADGYLYFATDVNGGTLYESDGAVWTKVAPAALEVGGTLLAYHLSVGGVTVVNAVAAGTALPASSTAVPAPTITIPAQVQPYWLEYSWSECSIDQVARQVLTRLVDETGATVEDAPQAGAGAGVGAGARTAVSVAVGQTIGGHKAKTLIQAGAAAHTYHVEGWILGGAANATISWGIKLWATRA